MQGSLGRGHSLQHVLIFITLCFECVCWWPIWRCTPISTNDNIKVYIVYLPSWFSTQYNKQWDKLWIHLWSFDLPWIYISSSMQPEQFIERKYYMFGLLQKSPMKPVQIFIRFGNLCPFGRCLGETHQLEHWSWNSSTMHLNNGWRRTL
jgi:hypothetical protein